MLVVEFPIIVDGQTHLVMLSSDTIATILEAVVVAQYELLINEEE